MKTLITRFTASLLVGVPLAFLFGYLNWMEPVLTGSFYVEMTYSHWSHSTWYSGDAILVWLLLLGFVSFLIGFLHPCRKAPLAANLINPGLASALTAIGVHIGWDPNEFICPQLPLYVGVPAGISFLFLSIGALARKQNAEGGEPPPAN